MRFSRITPVARAVRGAVWPVALPVACAALSGLVTVSRAQEAAGGRSLTLVPSAEVSETLTDNYRLSTEGKSADAITRTTASLGMRAQSARLKGFGDVSISALTYARHSSDNTTQRSLNSALETTLIDDRLVLESAATVSRSSISAFGAPSGSAELANSNSVETRSLSLAPRLRGVLAGTLRYSGRLNWAMTDAAGRAQGDTRTHGGTLHLEPVSIGRLGWAADASRVASSYKLGRATTDDRLTGQLTYRVEPLDLLLRSSGGLERTNLSSTDTSTRGTWSVGGVWAPSPRTRLDAEYGERFYGRTHAVNLEYRTPLTIWQASATRSVSTDNSQSTTGARGTAFELLYGQLASLVADPIQRLFTALELLSKYNLDPNARPDGLFLSSSAQLVDSVQLSAAWRGQRQTAVLAVGQDRSRRIDTITRIIDDLADTTSIRGRNLSLTLSHRLTPESTLSLVASLRQADGFTELQHSQQRQLSLSWSSALGRYLTGSVSLRHGAYELATRSYSESALSLNLGARF